MPEYAGWQWMLIILLGSVWVGFGLAIGEDLYTVLIGRYLVELFGGKEEGQD